MEYKVTTLTLEQLTRLIATLNSIKEANKIQPLHIKKSFQKVTSIYIPKSYFQFLDSKLTEYLQK